MSVPSFIFGPGAPARTPQEAARNRAVYEAVVARMGAPRDVGEGLSAVGNALVARSMMDRASAGEEAGAARVAELMSGLQDGADQNELVAALSDPWFAENKGGSAVAQALLQRELNAGAPDWQTFESGGDMYRWNANDPNSTPGLFFDGPGAPLDAPTIAENFDPETGRPRKQQWNAATGQWEDFGGVSAPDDPLVTVNTGGAGEDFYEAMDTDLGKQNAALIDAGRNAASNNLRLNQLGELLKTAPQGAEGIAVQFAGNLGIPTEGLDELQAAQAIINQLVPGQRPPGSGTMSDADLALYKASMPQIINQPGGNALIIQTAIAINEYTMAQAAIAEKVANREITPAEARAQQAAIPNPLAEFKAAVPDVGMELKRIASDAEYDALKSGDEFIDPDGKRRRKP